ncbi:5'-nucleotidase [Cellulosimicrobium sp. NPDC057127]|uniref:5'-nucleotidase n=1 Tax=Cellulosimicrobium sp. NPDC057127 TaxID=3346026 RepID=UPI00363B38B7
MGYDLTGRLVVGVASSALFDLSDADRVLRAGGEAAYRALQEEQLDVPLAPGAAFGFVRRLLALNDLAPADDPLVEVMVLSRRPPETGLRVMRSVRHHDLAITRAVFRQGRAPHELVRPLHVDLFLSADEAVVDETVDRGLPAGHVLDPAFGDEPGEELRVVFDVDGILADGPDAQAEDDLSSRRPAGDADVAPGGGALRDLLAGLRRVQEAERARRETDPTYTPRVHVALLTGRSAPAHERAVATLRAWGVRIDDAFFLGGVDPAGVLEMLRPHVVVGDRVQPSGPVRGTAPTVHVPYGASRRTAGAAPGTTSTVAPAQSPRRAAPEAAPVERAAGPARPAPATDAARPATSTALTVPGPSGRPTGTRELPVVTRVPELTVLGGEGGAPGAVEDSRRGRRAELAGPEGAFPDRSEAPKPLPVRQSAALARHH